MHKGNTLMRLYQSWTRIESIHGLDWISRKLYGFDWVRRLWPPVFSYITSILTDKMCITSN